VVTVHSYGKYIKLKTKVDKVINKKVLDVELLKYGRGFGFVH